MGWRLIEFRRECLLTTKDQLIPLIQAHWDEVEHNKESVELSPDWDQYALLEKAGLLRIFTARDGRNIVGYLSMMLNKSLHHKGHTFAVEDGLFLSKDYRSGSIASNLIRFMEKCIKSEGASLIFMTTKADHPIDPLLKRLRYNLTERVYSKNLIEV